jgi:hypothetical protein
VVECNLAKVEVAGSNPVSRSILRFVPNFSAAGGVAAAKDLIRRGPDHIRPLGPAATP